LHSQSRVARHAIVVLVRCMLRAGKASLSCLGLAPAGLGLLTGCRGSLHFRAGGGEAGDSANLSPAPALKGMLAMPPLNQSLWALLIASLTALAGGIIVQVSARVERERQERRTRRGLQN
jgi:hypothetical protein